MDEVDVVVVGAGLAGLVAARDLMAAGRSAVVLEARDRVGGRLVNHDIGGGEIVEMGGQWVGPTQDRVLTLLRQLGLETHPTYMHGEHLLEWRGALKRFTGTIPKISPAVLADFAQAQARLDLMARRVDPHSPWSAARAAEWDGRTVATWLSSNTITKGARELLEAGVDAVWAAPASDVSLLHLLFYVRSAGGLDMLWDTEGGAQQDRVVGGTQLLALRLAERLGDVVRLSSPVRSIAWGDDGVVVDGALRAARCIVAVPPTMALRISFSPGLPARRDQLLQRMPAGAVIKCQAVYDEPFWRREGLSGYGGSDIGPARLTYDNSPPSGSPGVLLAFVEGRYARDLSGRPAAERREAVLGVLARLFGERARRPEQYVERDWAAEEWTRGCYGAFLPPGAWTSLGDVLRPPVGPIHWAGAEHATRWSGYMDGAVRSGEEQAGAVLQAIS